MVISSLIVETTAPTSAPAVADALALVEGVEVHRFEGNQVIVTIEADTVDDSHRIAASFINIQGVINTILAYVNFEDDPSIAFDRA